jgi:hypothetical protein
VNGPYTRTYFDVRGREIRSETEGFDGSGSTTLVFVDTRYKYHRDWVSGKTNPYYNGQTAYWTSHNFDNLGG